MLITYGVNDGYHFDPKEERIRFEKMQAQKNYDLYRFNKLKHKKELLEKELVEVNKEIKEIESRAFNKLASEYEEKGSSKKDMIIDLYMKGVPAEKIQEYIDTDKNYVQKVLSLYRKEKGLKQVSKGDITRDKIISCLKAGKSSEETALHVGVTIQYVNRIKKEFEKR